MNFLAFDTSTDALSVAVSRGTGTGQGHWTYQGEGGAKASTSLIGEILKLLDQAELQPKELTAICFGSGPGSFTGLRTACAVAQGLAFGAGVPVLPIDSLLAVAEEARYSALTNWSQGCITAMLDARMDEMYAATFCWDGFEWVEQAESALIRPEAFQGQGHIWAGNVFEVYAGRLPPAQPQNVDRLQIAALPTASALLRLAPRHWARGRAVDPAQALPRYIRDKVAKTTVEREREKAAAHTTSALQ